MPFNGSGSYSPPGSPVFPPTPGSVISSSYFTQTINDIAQALSLTFLRDGSVPMGNDLNMLGNKVKLLGSGLASTPAISFSADGTSGFYYGGGAVNVAIQGAQAATFGSGGTLNVVGNLTEAGSRVWTAATLPNPVQTTGTTFTGPVVGTSLTLSSALAVGGTLTVTGATSVSTITASGAATVASLASSGAITQAGNQVWHAGNLNPGLYAPLANPVFSGNVGVGVSPNTAWKLHVGNPDLSATYAAVGNNNGATIAGVSSGGVSQLACYSQSSAVALGTFSLGSTFTEWARFASTGLNVAGAITQAGNQVWHAGNFTPGNYAALSGATFSGQVNGLAGIKAQSTGVGAAQPVLGAMDWTKTGLFVSNNSGAYGLLVGVDGVSGSSWLQAQRTDGTATPYYMYLQPAGGAVSIGMQNGSEKLNVGGNILLYASTDVSRKLSLSSYYGALDIGTTPGVTNGTFITYSYTNGSQGPLIIKNATGEVARFAPTGELLHQTSILATHRVYAGGVLPNLGRICLTTGTEANSGYLEFFRADSTREGYMGFAPAGGAIVFNSDTGAGFNVTGGPFAVAGALNVGGTATLAYTTFTNAPTRKGYGQGLFHSTSGLSGLVSRGTAAPSGGADGDIYLQYS